MESSIEEEVPSLTKQEYRPCQRYSTKRERIQMEYPDLSLCPPLISCLSCTGETQLEARRQEAQRTREGSPQGPGSGH